MTPSKPLTVILNYDQSKKFAFLPSSSKTKLGRDQLLREANNKFRVKGLSVVYLLGGVLLENDEDVPQIADKIWVGKGEPYAGPPADTAQSSSNHSAECVIRILATTSYIHDTAVSQLKYVSNLNGVRLVVGMPDLHPGDRSPIGCVVAARGIYPALIGSDVGCGISLYVVSRRSRAIYNPKKLASHLRGLDDPWSGSTSEWLGKYGIQPSSLVDVESLGTIGAGNHFAELCTVERIIDYSVAKSLKIEEDNLCLLVHSGSRGLGASILEQETKEESNPYISPESQHFNEYLETHDYAVRWAIANRDLIAHRIMQCLYPPAAKNEDMMNNEKVESFMFECGLEKIVDTTHNSVTRRSLEVDGKIEELWVHRKGAAPSDEGISVCPGSRGDFTWLLQPCGDGQRNAHSLPHGAGRRHARTAMRNTDNNKNLKANLTTTALGSEVICTRPDLLFEEQPKAYKDIQCIIDDVETEGISKGVLVLRPLVTYKTRLEGARK